MKRTAHYHSQNPGHTRPRRLRIHLGAVAVSVGLMMALPACGQGSVPDHENSPNIADDAPGSDDITSASSNGKSSNNITPLTACYPAIAIWPLDGASVTSIQDSYSYRTNNDIHSGMDLPTPEDTSARAVLDGKVIEVRQRSECGHPQVRITVEHTGNGCTFYSVYNHLKSSLVSTGAILQRGTLLGPTGWNCDRQFPHLHFELRHGCRFSECAVHPLRLLPYTWDSAKRPTISILSVDQAASSIEMRTLVPREQQDLIRARCSISKPGLTSSVYLDIEEAHAGTLFPNVSVNPASFGLGTPFHDVKYKFTSVDLTGVNQVQCWSENIESVAAPSAFWAP